MLDFPPLLSAIESAAAALGCFDRTQDHEPQNPPGTGVTFAVWPEDLRPSPKFSGLASTSVLLVMTARLYKTAQAEPASGIDPALISALQLFLNAVTGGFTLGGLVSAVDLLGMEGTPLSAKAGWLDAGDGAVFRIFDVTIPLIVPDVWSQAA